MREYYALYSCDVWKSHSSMTLIGVFNLGTLRKVIRQYLKKKDFIFGGDVKEIASIDVKIIDTLLEHGHIQKIQLNKIID